MKKRIFFIWSLLLITIGSFGSNKVYQQVITEQFRNEIAGIALNDSFPSADRFGNLYPGTVAQNIINVLNTDPSGVQLTKSEREYVIAIVSGLRPVWGKMKAVYGFVGGNAWKHKWNWKDMRDLDAAFRLSFSGVVTHNNMGIMGDGISGYANTFFDTFSEISPIITSMHISVYCNINIATNNTESSIGSTQGSGGNQVSLVIRRLNNSGFSFIGGTSSSAMFTENNSIGYYLSNRSSASVLRVFKNGNIISQNNSSSTTSAPSNYIYLLGRNVGGGTINFSEKRFSFTSIGLGLNDQEITQISNVIPFSQGILNRKQ